MVTADVATAPAGIYMRPLLELGMPTAQMRNISCAALLAVTALERSLAGTFLQTSGREGMLRMADVVAPPRHAARDGVAEPRHRRHGAAHSGDRHHPSALATPKTHGGKQDEDWQEAQGDAKDEYRQQAQCDLQELLG